MGAKSCKPCKQPCPTGFVYSESCGFWWWEEDSFSCTPKNTPTDAAVQSILDIKYTGCPCSTLGNCEGTVKRAESCGPGQTELKLEEDCCGAPFSNDGCKPGYGSHETRTCIEDSAFVFMLQDGARSCPDKFFAEMMDFEVCKWCDGTVKMDEYGAFLSCWLPYAADDEGNCFSYDHDDIGWFKNGAFAKGGTESFLPLFESSSNAVRPQVVTYPKTTTTHEAADKLAGGLGFAAVVVFGGFFVNKKRMKRAKKPNDAVGVALTGVGSV